MEKKKLFIKAINFFWRLAMCNDTMVHCAVTLPPLPLSLFGSVCLPLVHVSPHLEWSLLNEIKECCQEEKWKIGHCLLGSIIRVITVCSVGSQDSSDPLSSHSETKNNNNTSTALDNCCVMKSLVLSSLGHHHRCRSWFHYNRKNWMELFFSHNCCHNHQLPTLLFLLNCVELNYHKVSIVARSASDFRTTQLTLWVAQEKITNWRLVDYFERPLARKELLDLLYIILITQS